MTERTFYPLHGASRRGTTILTGSLVTSTSGDIDSQECDGFSVAKTATETGRYTITLHRPYVKIWGVVTTVIGADDTEYTKDKGLVPLYRDNDIASDGTIEVQFTAPTDSTGCTWPDAELEDAAKVLFVVIASRA